MSPEAGAAAVLLALAALPAALWWRERRPRLAPPSVRALVGRDALRREAEWLARAADANEAGRLVAPESAEFLRGFRCAAGWVARHAEREAAAGDDLLDRPAADLEARLRGEDWP